MKSLSFKTAFTMIELVFVIVILGILAGVAIPKLAVTRDDAMIAKVKSQVAAIQAGIANQRGLDMMRGKNEYPELSVVINNTNGLGNWTFAAEKGTVAVGSGSDSIHTFTYNRANGRFTCTSGKYCDQLMK